MMITELCELGFKYGTDKCYLKHNYTKIYYELLKDRRNEIRKVMEFGIGFHKDLATQEVVYDRVLRRNYHKGASLKMWRDFFPNAEIHGVDIRPEIMFSDDRITTHVCDTRNQEGIKALIDKVGSDFDFVVDDGSHRYRNQMFLADQVLPLLDDKVLYVIEDINGNCIDNAVYHLSQTYSVKMMYPRPRKWRGSNLLVVEKYA